MSTFRNILMIIAPIAAVCISLGIYYAVNKENFKSCTCSKDRNVNATPTSQETYTYTHNQPKTNLSGKEIELQPVNSFGSSTVETPVVEPPAVERYTTAYYKEPQNNPETHSRFSGV